MDAVQFGRWLGERRHAGGWPSQRALAEAARDLPETRGAALSEAFLARLEAGHLAHPFRGVVRQRVLALGWLLCKSARDARGYLRAAGLHDLSREETARVEQWMRRLAPARTAGLAVLPPRPARLVGREEDLAQVLRALTADGEAVVAITGMPGSGKSALAAELAHRLAARAADDPAMFPDGVVWVRATGQRGAHGLAEVLDGIAASLAGSGTDATARAERDAEAQRGDGEAPAGAATDAPMPVTARAAATGSEHVGARAALGDRRMLVVLDGMEDGLPLEAAVAALLARHVGGGEGAGRGGGAAEPGARGGHRAILITSRYRPTPALLSAHLHLGALAPEAALGLFAALVGHSLTDAEREAARLIGAAVGYLPVAMAAAATAVAARGIALPLLAARVSARPLDGLLDGDGELRALLARALEPLPEASRERFALLGALGAPSFGLEPVAALRTEVAAPRIEQPLPVPRSGRMAAVLRDALAVLGAEDMSGDAAGGDGAAGMAELAAVADELGHLVRHSLLEATPLPASAAHGGELGELGALGGERMPPGGQTHYAAHPLLMAYAVERLELLDPTVAQAARRSVREYALAFVERHHHEPRVLERERDLLLAVLTQAWGEADYAVVVRLVAGLWHLVSRVGSPALTARTLAWGISASQHLDDRYHLARFLGRLGSLRYYHGEPDQARQAWEASLEIAEQLRGPSELWYPLASLAMLACAEGDFLHAQRYAEAYLRRAERDGGIPAVAGALFKRGLCAHLAGDLDQAYADLNACTRLLALRGAGDKIAHDGIFEMAAQAELARVQGDFARAQHHMEIAVALAEEVCDHYVVADLLLDQARFARLQERQEEARALARRVVEVATRVEAHQLRLEGLRLLRQLPEAATVRSS